MTGPRVDRVTCSTAVAVMLAVCIPLTLDPETGGEVIDRVYRWIATHLGVFYQWATIGTTVFLAWLAFGRYGNRRSEKCL